MGIDAFIAVKIGFAVSFGTLRRTLNGLNEGGKRWWIATDPRDAVVNGTVTIGYGDPSCRDLLNRAFFQVPVIEEASGGSNDGMLLLVAPSAIMSGDVAEFDEFYRPLKDALISRLRTGE